MGGALQFLEIGCAKKGIALLALVILWTGLIVCDMLKEE